MSVVVTGGAGFIGSHCCVSLIEAGYDVVVVSAPFRGLIPPLPSENLTFSCIHVSLHNTTVR